MKRLFRIARRLVAEARRVWDEAAPNAAAKPAAAKPAAAKPVNELLWCGGCGGQPFPVAEGPTCSNCGYSYTVRPSHFRRRGEETDRWTDDGWVPWDDGAVS